MLDRFFGRRRVQPSKVNTDEVSPVYPQDGAPNLPNVTMIVTFRFHDVLEPEKLHGSLCRLVETGGWRRIGGRLRKDAKGKLELHIPRPFTAERQAAGMTHTSFDTCIDDHPLARQLPRPTPGQFSMQPAPNQFLPLAFGDTGPKVLEDWLSTDAPQVWIHIVSFRDATLVTLRWLHLTSDAMGISHLVSAWSQVLAGKEDEIPPMLSLEHDPVGDIVRGGRPGKDGGTVPEERLALADKRVTGVKLFLFIVRFLVDLLLYPRAKQQMMFLPRAVVQKLKSRALSELEEDCSSNIGPAAETVLDRKTGKPFLSTGDVTAAWLAQVAAQSIPPTSRRTHCIVSAMDLRERVPSVVDIEKGVYVQNFASTVWTMLPSQVVHPHTPRSASLGKLAGRLRWDVAQQSTEPQIRAAIRMECQNLEATGQRLLFGDPSNFLTVFTNWTRTRFDEVADFSPAVVLPAGAKPDWPTETLPGRAVYFHGSAVIAGEDTQSLLGIYENSTGDVWINGVMPPHLWSVAEEELRKI
ncbi:uncharacterized protein E0L32_011054 [Thyridium curvatum]|uniref:Uncharacterized protein n=1 Tax=Thyridium curvatum TaxID=1093900 RepID=A0A507AKZ7_9PEZI|nr:uncharacterized protein E0L32_011054 [Thyridium curvatum]TPX07066.1 hypothetical protein E0L32_011054 [Thyridium curvatum]